MNKKALAQNRAALARQNCLIAVLIEKGGQANP